jgi:hypothetical protein
VVAPKCAEPAALFQIPKRNRPFHAARNKALAHGAKSHGEYGTFLAFERKENLPARSVSQRDRSIVPGCCHNPPVRAKRNGANTMHGTGSRISDAARLPADGIPK